ncbi:MAG: ATP-binding protein [Porphyromonadaceae bacterium]|nr:ATP-binding protein [Porphyromonadaceae bacterium]
MDRIDRQRYLDRLIAGHRNGLIKIVTGLRRSGKSYLLFQIFHDHLISEGVNESHIIEIALDDVLNEEYLNPRNLLTYIRSRIIDNDLYYVLLDEVQMVDNFVGTLNSLLHIRNVDVYVTGSNSKFLSSDIATEFRGRGDEIRIHPLSFAEFLPAYGGSRSDAWKDYCTYGGLPLVLSLETEEKKVRYLQNLYKTVYLKDVVERNKIRRLNEFEKLVKIMASTIGAPTNPNKLANTFKSVEGVDLNSETIGFYLSYLQDAFILDKSMRFDIKGRKYIGTLPKYYFSDTGLRNAILDFRQQEETHLMENIIYNELSIRGFNIDTGDVDVRSRNDNGSNMHNKLEVDFVANLGSKRYYIQSALAIPDASKMSQETASLQSIHDNFRKVIIVKDDIIPWHNEDGILILGLFDFLLKEDSLDY